MQSYIRTYYRLRRGNLSLLPWAPTRVGPLISASAVPHREGMGVGGGGRFEHPRGAEVAPTCLVAFYDTRSESSGVFYYPTPAGDRNRLRHSVKGKIQQDARQASAWSPRSMQIERWQVLAVSGGARWKWTRRLLDTRGFRDCF